jgi:spermidine synthase
MPLRVSYKFIKTADAALLSEIISLYKKQGWWTAKDKPELLTRIIKGSHCFVVAVAQDRMVGIGRAVSDKASDAYIQDVLVKPQSRGEGVGAGIILRLKARLLNDGIKWIGLIAQDNSKNFYGPLGFKAIDHADPMMLKSNHV